METPPYYQQPVTPAPPYYPMPAAYPRRENTRALALGLLNVVFGFVYLLLAISTLVAGLSYDLDFSSIVQVLGIGWAAIGLLWGGIELLKGNTSVAGIIRSVFWVVLAMFLVSMCSIFTQVDSRYFGAVIVSFLTQIFLFSYYPFVAFFVAGKLEEGY